MEKNISKEELNNILNLHEKWLNNEKGGVRADLSYVNLSYVNFHVNLSYVNFQNANLSHAGFGCVESLNYADLSYADLDCACLGYARLSYANLSHANLTNADLECATLINTNLTNANLEFANLSDANLKNADLSNANLTNADLFDATLINTNLTKADLRYADLQRANVKNTDLTNAIYDTSTAFAALQCPEEGAFVGYKRAGNKIIKLLILEDSKRFSATTRKCRCDKAKVLSITNLDGSDSNLTEIASDCDKNFIYKIGEIAEVKDFDEDRWKLYDTTGIHFFITRDEAVNSHKQFVC